MCAQPSRSETQKMSSAPLAEVKARFSTQLGNEYRPPRLVAPVLGSTAMIDIRLYPRDDVMTNRRSALRLQRGDGLKLIDGDGASCTRMLVLSMMSTTFTSDRKSVV